MISMRKRFSSGILLSGGIVALWLRDMPFSNNDGRGFFVALSGVAALNGLVVVSLL